MPQTLLTIAGTDPTSGAGVTADLAVFGDFGFHGLWVPTAILDQDTSTVHRLEARPATAVADGVSRILKAGRPSAIKIGLLASSEVAAALSDVLRSLAGRIPVVLDPVLASGRGARLADDTLVETLRDALLPVVTVLTPNIPEAEALIDAPIADLARAREAAQSLLALGSEAVLLKGGHLEGAPGDVWADSRGVQVLANREVFPSDVHGTGCHLSSALAALLALGVGPRSAARGARGYLSECMASCQVLDGDADGRPIIVHGEPTRRAAVTAITRAAPGPRDQR